MLTLLKAYQKRLVNLNSSNKSLLLLTLPAGQFADIHELDFLDNRPSFDIIQQLIAGKSTIPLCDIQDSRYEKSNEMSKTLNRLARSANFIAQERGTQDLYVGYPMVRGKFSDGTLVRCPLLFFPVTLVQEKNKWVFQKREGESIQFNKSFVLAYAYFNKVKIADEWLETDLDELNKDSLAFRTELYELLKTSPLEINFNPDSFTNTLQAFQLFKKTDFEESHKNGELKLFSEAVVGIFPQAGSYLMPDYQKLIDKNLFPETEDFFHEKIIIPLSVSQPYIFSLKDIREEHLLTPLPIDSSQEHAIRMVKSGQSVVIQGPPGTGKSQLIANLIADYTAQGKRVLLVCQKRAALDVVHARLTQLGLGDFLALVHDFKQDRKAIFDQLNRQIDNLDEYKRQNLSLDALYLERTFLAESRRIDKHIQELEEFRQALFADTLCGLSVKELYLTCSLEKPHVSLKSVYKLFRFGELDDFVRRLQIYESYTHLEDPSYFWQNRVLFHVFTPTDEDVIAGCVEQIPEVVTNITAQVQAVWPASLTIAKLATLSIEEQSIRQWLSPIQDETQWQIFQEYLTGKHKKIDTNWLKKYEQALLKCLKGEGIEKTLAVHELPEALQLFKNASKARQNVFSWLYWQFFSGEKKRVQTIADNNHFTLQASDLKKMTRKLENRILLEKLTSQLQKIWPTGSLYEKDSIQQWFANQRAGRKAHKLYKDLKSKDILSQALALPLIDFQKKIFQLLEIAHEWQMVNLRWSRYLTGSQIEFCCQHPANIPSVIQQLADDFDALHELDTLKMTLAPAEREVIKILTHLSLPNQDLYRQAGIETSSFSWANIFDNSLRLTWIEEIEKQFPVLRAVSTHKLTQLEDELQAAVLKKQKLSQNVVRMKLCEQTYRHLVFNRLNNLITYRDIKHQVTKKRSLWSIRKLMAELGEEVFQLVPCWMASPESVSAIFDLFETKSTFPDESSTTPTISSKILFDLVIFDEASQCFAERGIPAMFRGRQIVITGDGKQLQPSDLYQIRYEEKTEDVPDLEVNSLLDLATRYLPQVQLKGHYRSQALELIDFSNQHFYQNNLTLLPDFQIINQPDPAIRYIKTEGIWQNNQNRQEAESVVQLLWQLFQQYPDKEVGVVTFNYTQQNLIQDLLETSALEQKKLLPSHLFIKNIENVQGDERDIIVFSIGYAPDTNGRLTMQFGSLNTAGGENRLNVAVTRAREKIYVISSLYPQQLHTDDVLHPGPKLLKQYLEYAWQVSEGKYVPQPKNQTAFVSKQLLKDKIMENPSLLPETKDSHLYQELPFADITLKNADTYQSLLLTDDDLYYQSPSKDAHAYTPLLLQAKHWTFKRLYSRQWWKQEKRTGTQKS